MLEPADHAETFRSLLKNKAGTYYKQKLEEHDFEGNKYDCIWIQWCLDLVHDDFKIKSFL